MDAVEIKDEVIRITDLFGMSGKKAAEIMGMQDSGFRHRARGSKGYYFTEEHSNALKHFIKEEAARL